MKAWYNAVFAYLPDLIEWCGLDLAVDEARQTNGVIDLLSSKYFNAVLRDFDPIFHLLLMTRFLHHEIYEIVLLAQF